MRSSRNLGLVVFGQELVLRRRGAVRRVPSYVLPIPNSMETLMGLVVVMTFFKSFGIGYDVVT